LGGDGRTEDEDCTGTREDDDCAITDEEDDCVIIDEDCIIVKEDELCKSSLDELWASPPNETSDSFGEMEFTDSEFPQAKRNSGKRRATPFAKLQTYPINNTSKGK
jgi:hypothetical protein